MNNDFLSSKYAFKFKNTTYKLKLFTHKDYICDILIISLMLIMGNFKKGLI